MKFQRQAKILELIGMFDIETQSDLTSRLLACGFKTTQATISRDIKDLRLIKVPSKNGRSKYAVSVSSSGGYSNRLLSIFKESVISYDIAQNIVVIKTMPGLASAACSAIDGMHIGDIVGTIAGDDTGFLLLRDNQTAIEFFAEIRKLLG